MPTQAEVEFLRQKHQQFSPHKLSWSVLISLSTNVVLAPLEFIKVRSQLMQEGRVIHGASLNRGVPAIKLVYEVVDSGAGLRGLYKGFDTLIMRGLVQGSTRPMLWCSIFNYLNPDPRSKVIYYFFV